ncbi:hypothetical protein TNIN_151291 [Trichonephila inaurata madagascariensis]|uniref:Uncharacterized protein n=1 Tax=Trichonephila inaurata madagascariensis TaxID=2747483 RepID=A0A8X7BM99_9ARAC|nr:hypothetical protein TNIN_151291 [Trichonephila inaurata madagascariensis]
MLTTQHLLNIKQSFREYFPVAESKNNCIRDPFAEDVCKKDGLTSVEEQLTVISTDGALILVYKPFPNFWVTYRKIVSSCPRKF